MGIPVYIYISLCVYIYICICILDGWVNNKTHNIYIKCFRKIIEFRNEPDIFRHKNRVYSVQWRSCFYITAFGWLQRKRKTLIERGDYNCYKGILYNAHSLQKSIFRSDYFWFVYNRMNGVNYFIIFFTFTVAF